MSLPLESPGLTVAVALAVGLAATALARHLRLPGIVLLLASGVALSRDGLGVIDPEVLGPALQVLVGYAVAVIVFEGGLNLNLGRLRRQAVPIRRLITIGALITAAGGAVLAHLAMDWPWRISILFGTLVMVTGPTVITPLLRRTRVRHELQTILEAEGVFIDAIGVLTAIAAFDVALHWSAVSALDSIASFGLRFGGGCLLGLAGGAVMAAAVHWDRMIPEGLENVFVLSLALVLFQVSDTLLPESGIAAAAVAGVLVGNTPTRIDRELREFKEQLTVMFIGMLFVLLAAQVGLQEVLTLGWPGLITVLGLMLVVRPLNVLVSTAGTDLTARDRAFLCWLAPRGVVAAAMASLFAQQLTAAGVEGGTEMRALVFLVIGVTVLVQGLLAGPVAWLLGVGRPNQGYVILGANGLSLQLGRLLGAGDQEIVFVDNNAAAIEQAEEAGMRAIWGSGLDDSVLQRVELDARLAAIGLTPNEEANGIFAAKARSEFRVPRALAAVQGGTVGVRPERLEKGGAAMLFGAPVDVAAWARHFEREEATVEAWRFEARGDGMEFPEDIYVAMVPLAWQARRGPEPIDERFRPRAGHEVWFAVRDERRDRAHGWLRKNGWQPVDKTPLNGVEVDR
ncbi:MAG TPA: sodium:proton antiporter [Acidobacteriota bacterium]